MPNKYIKKKIPRYTREDITNAVREVKNDGLSMYAAAQKYGIPTTTLFDKIKETYSTNVVGRRLAIPLEIENRLADAIKVMEKWGFGLSREEVLNLVALFVTSNNLDTPFTNNKPGKDWFTNFRKRHRLSIKKPQPVEYVRKKMTDPFVISEYFELLAETLTVLNLSERPHLIWNMDETSLSLDPTKTKVVGAINKPCSRTTCGTGKENITVLATVSASGKKLSPMIVFKGKNVWDQWMAETEHYDFELSYAASARGWMETDIFYNYMEKVLIPALGEERPVLVIYDGHSTHVDVKVIELAIKNDVTILKLPPHTSHLLQPLDVAVFKSFKTKWDKKLVEWQRHNVGTKMPKKVFAQTFAETWAETSSDVIQSGFKKTGIHPFNSEVVPEDKYDPSAYRRYRDTKALSLEAPKSLKKLCIAFFNTTFQDTQELPVHDRETMATNEMTLTTLSKTDKQNQRFVATSTSKLPECLQNKEKKHPKIHIISDVKINFEELLLEKIRQDKKDTSTVKKKRVAKGAEVITAAIYKKNAEEKKSQDIEKTRDLKNKSKLKAGIKKAKNENCIAKPGPSGIEKKTDKLSKKKSKRKDSNSSSTSISDIMSIYSEEEYCYRDFVGLTEEIWSDKQIQDEKPKQETTCSESEEREIFIKHDLNTQQFIKKEKGKGKGKKTKAGKENKAEINSRIDKTDEGKITKDKKRTTDEEEPTKDKKHTDEDKKEEENKDEYSLNDAVLVRYFTRKKWTYYIGFIEKIFQKHDETFYSINFLRTIKKPHLTFVQPKKKDRDEITKILIVKKVEVQRSNEYSGEFILLDENNKIYF